MGSNPLISENPDLDDLRRLEEAIYEFNVQATGISDGRLFASFLRDAEKRVIGGISGWTWAKTCFIGHLFVPAELRKQGYGTRGGRLKQSTEDATRSYFERMTFKPRSFTSSLALQQSRGFQTIRSVTKKSR